MTTTALLRSYAYVDGWDATGDSNDLGLSAKANPLAATTFRDAITNGGWEVIGATGHRSAQVRYAGFWSAAAAGSVDDQAFANLATQRVVTIGTDETEGAVAYMLRAAAFDYQAFGKIGELAPFTLGAKGVDGVGLIRGRLAKKTGSVSATGALGTAAQLGAVGSTQYLYATLHLLGTAGTSITVVVESDDNAGFTSATTRATFGPLTAVGGSWATRVAGSIADTYWRLRVTAITGTWTVAGAIAIQ